MTGLTAGTTYYFRVAASNSTGTTRAGNILNFIPPASEWVSTGPMVAGRTWHKATLLPQRGRSCSRGGELAAVTYDTAQPNHPASGTFDNTASMAERRTYSRKRFSSNGKVLVAGGRTYNDNLFLSSAELYDPDAGTFSPTAEPMGTARPGCTRPPVFRTARC